MGLNSNMNNKLIGNAGEDLARRYLEKNNYEIIDQNVRFSKFCEIDIIAKHKDTIVFVEVKTRMTDLYGKPFDSITKTKYSHLKKGVLYYIQEHNTKKYRIDIIGITLKPEIKIQHLKNISM